MDGYMTQLNAQKCENISVDEIGRILWGIACSTAIMENNFNIWYYLFSAILFVLSDGRG